jgi:hypothetical protein
VLDLVNPLRPGRKLGRSGRYARLDKGRRNGAVVRQNMSGVGLANSA